MDPTRDERSDLLYALIEECVRREKYWRERYADLENQTQSMMTSASTRLTELADENRKLKESK